MWIDQHRLASKARVDGTRQRIRSIVVTIELVTEIVATRKSPRATGTGRQQLTKREMPAALIEKSWARLAFTTELPAGGLAASVAEAQSVGFLKEARDLSKLIAFPK